VSPEQSSPNGRTVTATGALLPDLTALVESFPAPALLVDGFGSIQAMNDAGAAFAGLLDDHDGNQLRHLILAVATSDAGAQHRIRLSEARGAAVLDLTALPSADGAVALFLRDVSLETNLITALKDSRGRYKDLVACSSDFSWETDRDGQFVFVSPDGALGYAAEELVDGPSDRLIKGTRPGAEAAMMAPFRATEALNGLDIELKDRHGAVGWFRVAAMPIIDEAGQWQGARGVCRDVTKARRDHLELMRAERMARLENAIFRAFRREVDAEKVPAAAAAALANAIDGALALVFRMTGEGTLSMLGEAPDLEEDLLTNLGRSAQRMLAEPGDQDQSRETALGGSLMMVRCEHRGDVKGALCLHRRPEEGPWTDEERFLADRVAAHLGIAIVQIEALEALQSLSQTDPLTGLLNRRAFYERIAKRLAHQRRTKRTAALLFVDLDNFKPINDGYGHNAGDQLLCDVAALLARRSRAGDLIARFGGDEFCLWLDEVTAEGAQVKAANLVEEITQLTTGKDGEPAGLGLSIGIAVTDPRSEETVDHLLDRADRAMYETKNAGKGGYTAAPSAKITG